MLKIHQARFQQYLNQELPDVQTGFRKGRGTRDQIANICWIIEKARKFQKKKKIYSVSLTLLKSLSVWILRNLYAIKKQLLEPYVEQLTISKLRKESDKAVYCHPIYLTYMQSTSYEIVTGQRRFQRGRSFQ